MMLQLVQSVCEVEAIMRAHLFVCVDSTLMKCLSVELK